MKRHSLQYICFGASCLFSFYSLIYSVPEPQDHGTLRALSLFPNQRYNNIPRNGKIAIILRGIPFLSPGMNVKHNYNLGCDNKESWRQLKAIQSLVDRVIFPLENENNTIDIVITSSIQNCTLVLDILSILGTTRILAFESFTSKNQLYSIKFASDLFIDVGAHSIGDIANYDLVIFSRIDIFWKTSIDQWIETDFLKFNFFSRCTRFDLEPVQWPCVNDIIHIMPGSYFEKWYLIALECFSMCGNHSIDCPLINGHNCYKLANEVFGKNVGLIINSKMNSEVEQIAALSRAIEFSSI